MGNSKLLGMHNVDVMVALLAVTLVKTIVL